MPGFWIFLSWDIKKSSVSWKLEKLILRKYKKLFQSRFKKKYKKRFREKCRVHFQKKNKFWSYKRFQKYEEFFGAKYFYFFKLGLKSACSVICNCNVANLDVVALCLSERLNNNLYYTLEEYFFSGRIYIFFSALFVSQDKNSSNTSTREKKTNSLIVRFFIFMKV